MPVVSIIVPARNEEDNIGSCLTSLRETEYPSFEIIVVDDGSEDRTGEIVRSFPGRAGVSVRLVSGAPLPPGWFGKPWACWQGAREARGDLLLFTDADTQHAPGLLGRSIRALEEDGADVLTLVGRQGLGSFWEQLLQPQFFSLLAARYPRVGVMKKPHQWRHAIANGQYLLFRRSVYDSLGGHQAVASEVVDDLRLAQLLVKGGWRVTVRETEEFYTRMYRSLGGIVEGWSKNVATAARQTSGRWLRPVILPLFLLVHSGLWLVPPFVLTWSLVTGAGGLLLRWAILATALSVFIWSGASAKMRGNPLFGFLYPLGSAVALFIVLKSWMSGRIRWKGRDYPPSSRETEEMPSRDGSVS